MNGITGEQRHRFVLGRKSCDGADYLIIEDLTRFCPWIAGPPPKPVERELDEMAQRLRPDGLKSSLGHLPGGCPPTLGFSKPVEGDGKGGLRAVTPTPANPEAVLTLQIEMMPDRSCVLSRIDFGLVRIAEIIRTGDIHDVGFGATRVLMEQDEKIIADWRRAACPSAG